METTEICRINREAIKELLAGRRPASPSSPADGNRRVVRWPFPGTVELWVPDQAGHEWHALATSTNLSENGIGVRCEQPLEPGMELEIAIHEPEMSFHGRAVVRHCSEVAGGTFLAGMQFRFDE